MRDLKKAEELKRERNWNPAMRWRVLQDTIAWVEAQRAARRNDPAERRREETARLRRG
jgi:hypothetical protein